MPQCALHTVSDTSVLCMHKTHELSSSCLTSTAYTSTSAGCHKHLPVVKFDGLRVQTMASFAASTVVVTPPSKAAAPAGGESVSTGAVTRSSLASLARLDAHARDASFEQLMHDVEHSTDDLMKVQSLYAAAVHMQSSDGMQQDVRQHCNAGARRYLRKAVDCESVLHDALWFHHTNVILLVAACKTRLAEVLDPSRFKFERKKQSASALALLQQVSRRSGRSDKEVQDLTRAELALQC